MPGTISGRVRLPEVERFAREALVAAGVGGETAAIVADVFVRATARGVGHHDLADLASRLEALATGVADAAAEPVVTADGGALVLLDGRGALGELATHAAAELARERAHRHGVGVAVVVRSNHFLAAFPYVERLAERRCIGIVMSRTLPSMGVPGGATPTIGNSPIGFGVPAPGGDVLFDASLAYASWGELMRLQRDGSSIPAHWALDRDGRSTTDPGAALTGAIQPIGGYKGASLALLVEALTGVLGGGAVADEGWRDGQLAGAHSQTVIVVDPATVGRGDAVPQRMGELRHRLAELAPDHRLPGSRSLGAIDAARRDGVAVADAVVADLAGWADRLGIAALTVER